MPLISIKTSIKEIKNLEEFQQEISAELARLTGKPEQYVMTLFEVDVPMTFAGVDKPSCFIEIKSIGGLQPSLISQSISNLINEKINIPKDRIYINFEDISASQWGYNGSTFG